MFGQVVAILLAVQYINLMHKDVALQIWRDTWMNSRYMFSQNRCCHSLSRFIPTVFSLTGRGLQFNSHLTVTVSQQRVFKKSEHFLSFFLFVSVLPQNLFSGREVPPPVVRNRSKFLCSVCLLLLPWWEQTPERTWLFLACEFDKKAPFKQIACKGRRYLLWLLRLFQQRPSVRFLPIFSFPYAVNIRNNTMKVHLSFAKPLDPIFAAVNLKYESCYDTIEDISKWNHEVIQHSLLLYSLS